MTARQDKGPPFIKMMIDHPRKERSLALLNRQSGLTLLVLWAIALHINKKNECYPGQDTICKIVGCSPATVKRAIKNLSEIGALEITPRAAPGGRGNVYRVNPALFQYGRTRWNLWKPSEGEQETGDDWDEIDDWDNQEQKT